MLKVLENYIRLYGVKYFIYIACFEIFYIVKTLDFKVLNLDKYQTKKKTFNGYNASYFPTSYYYLCKINKFLKINRISNAVLDFGSGDGRPGKIFKNTSYFGFDNNKKFSIKKKKFIIYDLNLRNLVKFREIISKINTKKYKKIFLFFNDPFEISLIKKIINQLNFLEKSNNTYLIIINSPKPSSFVNRGNLLIYKKYFNKKKKNILIFKKIKFS